MSRKPTRTLIASVALSGLAFGGLTACGASDDDFGGKVPAGYLSIGGETYCGFLVDRDECSDSGIDPAHWVQMPASEPVDHSRSDYDLMAAMYKWHLMYGPYYDSPAYYNRYIPESQRATYTNVYVTGFTKANQAQLKTYASKNPSDAIPGAKVAPPAKPFNTKNDGGNRNGTRNCGMGAPDLFVAELPGKGSGTGGGSGGVKSSTSGGSSSSGGTGSKSTSGGSGDKSINNNRNQGGTSRNGC